MVPRARSSVPISPACSNCSMKWPPPTLSRSAAASCSAADRTRGRAAKEEGARSTSAARGPSPRAHRARCAGSRQGLPVLPDAARQDRRGDQRTTRLPARQAVRLGTRPSEICLPQLCESRGEAHSNSAGISRSSHDYCRTSITTMPTSTETPSPIAAEPSITNQ